MLEQNPWQHFDVDLSRLNLQKDIRGQQEAYTLKHPNDKSNFYSVITNLFLSLIGAYEAWFIILTHKNEFNWYLILHFNNAQKCTFFSLYNMGNEVN